MTADLIRTAAWVPRGSGDRGCPGAVPFGRRRRLRPLLAAGPRAGAERAGAAGASRRHPGLLRRPYRWDRGPVLLVHGLAGIALARLALGFARALSAGGPPARWTRATGLAAALVSVLQVVLALIACAVADAAPPSTSAELFAAVDDADTVKLLLLASFAATVTYRGGLAGAVRGWLRGLGYLLVPLLVLGGLAFRIDNALLYLLLAVSLVVLLLWAASASWVIARRGRG